MPPVIFIHSFVCVASHSCLSELQFLKKARLPLPCSDVIPDSEDEEEEEQFCFQATQAAYQEALESCQAGASPSSSGSPGGSGSGGSVAALLGGGAASAGQAAWLQEPAFRGAANLTLVLPRDGQGELGHATRCFPVPGRIASVEQLLQHIHEYYQASVFDWGCSALLLVGQWEEERREEAWRKF